MPKLIIKRTNTQLNKISVYDIFIDGKNRGWIEDGQLKEYDISSGNHTVKAKVNWFCSPELNLEVEENSVIKLELDSSKFNKRMPFVGLGITFLYFVLSFFWHFEFTLFVFPPLMLVMFYTFTFGRKKYLSLKKV